MNQYESKIKVMKKIKNMIETSFSKKDALSMLETYRIYGTITENQYQKGRQLIKKEYQN